MAADGSFTPARRLRLVPRNYLAVGRRLGLAEDDVMATWWHAVRDPGYYHGARGPDADDIVMTALRAHASIACCGYGTRGVGGQADDLDYADRMALLIATIAYASHGPDDARPRALRREQQKRRGARELHQLWFCGVDWRVPENEGDDGEAE